MAKNTKKMVERIQRDLKYAAERFGPLQKQMKDDFKFLQGSQWDDKDVEFLRSVGVKALTINKLKPISKLLSGIERQSQTDAKAYPEGGEDELSSDIATRLLKNISKRASLQKKESEVFKNGSVCGMCFIEPYMDYSFDIINGDLKWKKVSGQNVYIDPDFQEYDLSDAKYVIKLSKDLSEDDLLLLFPEEEAKIKKIENGKIDFDNLGTNSVSRETDDYPALNNNNDISTDKDINEKVYDLVDYWYKELQTRYFVPTPQAEKVEIFDNEEEANQYAAQFQGEVFDRKVPVIMLAQMVGNTQMYNGIAWSYPRWKSYPIIPYFAELITEDLDDYSLKIQGFVRGIKDLQEEYNKRRTQELRHINSSANSGFDIEEGQLSKDEERKLKKSGSSAGVVIKRKKGSPPINRITPMPLSQGHAQLAAENAQDMKEASGVNPDLLASDSKSQSGRAILLKQRQGLVMIQEMLDNFSETKRLIGRFELSQLSELFTIETAMKVVGDAFISENFTVPVNVILERALTKLQNGKEVSDLEQATVLQYPEYQPNQPIVDDSNQLVTTVDMDTAIQTINNVLTNVDLNKYDVAIGEGPYQDTIRMANFMDLKDLAQQGVPIPPQSLIETSMLPTAEKKNILRQLAAQMQTGQAQPA